MNYSVVNGRIETHSLEVHLSDHCNLRCANCCSLSPFLPRYFVEPATLERDLALCRYALKPRLLKLTGGEPLLHPRLLDCLDIARQSKLAASVSVTTNGLLLHTMPPDFWQRLDMLTLSLYPSSGLSERRVRELRAMSLDYDITFNLKRQDEFQRMTRSRPADTAAVRSTFEACWLRHRCHMVREGRFYACTRPPHFDTYFGHGQVFGLRDGIELHTGESLRRELLEYLTRDHPLDSCWHCLGGGGDAVAHRQLTLEEVRITKR